jgi:mono/diheme cytochrome c family protein
VLAASARELIEADWLRQAEALSSPPGRGAVPTWADAAGAVDGVKNGRYAFHTARERNPWWQVDLGKRQPIARIVVYNRLDYAPGLHNADGLKVLTSDDGKAWTLRHDNRGKHFGGLRGAKPLEVRFKAGQVRARFVRLALEEGRPVYFHLDEVEIYGPADAKKNIALKRPADQSSISQWSTAKVAVRPAAAISAYPTKEVIERGRLLAADLRAAGVDVRRCEGELDAAAAELSRLPDDAPTEARRALYLKARWAVRRLAFANPLLRFDRLLFVKRFTQETYPDVCLNHMPWVSRPGGDICVLSPASPDGKVRGLLNGALGPGHVHGMDLWWGGDRVVFGYARAKSDKPPDGWRDRRTSYRLRRTEEPIHLFEIGTGGKGPRQLTRGEWSDLDPTYLPSGEIAFVSERCAYSLQCNEYDKDETSCNLYVMGPDGGNIRRLSVTKDGDYLPHTLDDGTIGYTRWEYQERGWAHVQSIWTVRPDGTGADALFKQHLNDPWALEDVRSIPGSRKLVAIATGHHTLPAGPVVVIDPGVGMNDSAGIGIVTPGVRPPEGGMSGRPVPQGGVADRGGFYMTPWPLSEASTGLGAGKYFLVSYCYGRQTDATGYGLYLIDVFGTKELIYRDPGISCFVPMPLRPRKRPPILPDTTDPSKPYATCAVSDAGRGVEGVDPKRIRYLRISQRMAWPYDNTRGGRRYAEKARPNNWTPARVIGTVPVAADGSACFRVPPETPVYFQLLDANQMELRRMRSFISFQPGEVRACSGCHETRGEAPTRGTGTLALRRGPSEPMLPPWGDRVVSFLRDVQPVFESHCVRCHRGLEPAGGLDFSGGLTARHNRAFDTIIQRRLVSWSNVNEDARVTQPLAFGSHRSKLVGVLRGERHRKRVRLGKEDWLRLVTWIDLNAPYHDGFVNKRPAVKPYDMPSDRDLAGRLAAVHARRCASCHKPADVSRVDWIDIHRPGGSLFLAAPLAKAAGGTGRCQRAVYRDRADGDYEAVLQMVEAAVKRLWDRPRRDVKALKRPGQPVAAGVRPGRTPAPPPR